MSTTFFIAPYDPILWKHYDEKTARPTSELFIESADYRAALAQRWPEITFSLGCEACGLEFELPLDSAQYSGLRGCLQTNGQIVDFETAPPHIFVDYILWHRLFVPFRHTLYLFNMGSWESLVLTSETTEFDIMEFTGIVA